MKKLVAVFLKFDRTTFAPCNIYIGMMRTLRSRVYKDLGWVTDLIYDSHDVGDSANPLVFV